jgi:predicted SnoaL-like aldol condensation-catalyzing enzyme
MKKTLCLLALIAASLPLFAQAQVPVTGNPNHEAMLASKDPKLAANKKLVYDFWREVFEAGHLELVDKYMADSYIQHNPLAATGKQGFLNFFKGRMQPKPIEAKMKAPLVAIMAEGDMVTLAFAREQTDASGAKYTTTWFDMFRIENGKMAEHWDPQTKPSGPPPAPKP